LSAPELFLLIPALFGPRGAGRAGDAAAGVPTAGLLRLLARADALTAGDTGLDGALFRVFGVDPGDSAAPPVAPLTLLFDGGAPPAGYWLRADPVHLRAGQDKVALTGGAALQLGAAEAAALCAEINEHLAGEGLRLVAAAAARWYLALPEAPAARFSPLEAVLGQDVRPHLPQGEDGRAWRRRLNEIQMLLHASEVNRRRGARGQLEINSVWFWGGGILPPAGAGRFTHAWGDHPLLGGLARHAGLVPRPLPADAVAWLPAAEAGCHLMVLDALAEPALLSDVEAWRDGLRALLEHWIDPLWPLLRQGRLGALVIGSAGALDYHISPKQARRWWRRARPIAAYR
jgi:hypothetical protein